MYGICSFCKNQNFLDETDEHDWLCPDCYQDYLDQLNDDGDDEEEQLDVFGNYVSRDGSD